MIAKWLYRGSGCVIVRSLVFTLLCWLISSACAVPSPAAPSTVPIRAMKTASLKGQPFDTMLPKLHPTQREFLEFFAATVPEPLPEMAYPSWVALNPDSPLLPEGPLMVNRSDGYAEVQIGMANPGSHINRPNVICLRDGVQVGCTPETDVWEVMLPPKTLALVPTRIPASSGDHLVFVFLANDEPKRIDLGSQMVWAYVEQHPDPPSAWVDAPVHTRALGGCDFVAFVKDPTSTTSPINIFMNADTPRGTIIYLLIQLCNPTSQEYVQLVPIVDRTTVVDLPDDIWHSPVRLTSVASVIPVNTAWLGLAREFQVVVVPLSKEAASALEHHKFTQAIALSDQ